MDELLVSTADGVCTLELNRPSARNAMTAAMRQGLVAAARQADDDPAVAVIVVTGADPAFCAGVDLNEIAAGGASDAIPSQRPTGDDHLERYRRNPGTGLREVRKPLIAAVNGPCYTGGLELALNCDIVVASDRAVFADTHARFGLVPYWGMSALLPERVGFSQARRMALTGRPVRADEALRLGLVDDVVAHDDLITAVTAMAADIVAAVPSAVAAAQRLYDAHATLPVPARLALEMEVAEGFRFDAAEFERRLADRSRR